MARKKLTTGPYFFNSHKNQLFSAEVEVAFFGPYTRQRLSQACSYFTGVKFFFILINNSESEIKHFVECLSCHLYSSVQLMSIAISQNPTSLKENHLLIDWD